MYYFIKGDDYPPFPDEDISMWTAGIHRTDADGNVSHGDCIEIYAKTEEEANRLREFVLSALHTERVLTEMTHER